MLDKPLSSTTIRVGRHYEILRRLNTGGMASVYLGRLCGAHGFSRLVALKSMHAHHAADATFAAMFVDEARLTAYLRHPNIVTTLDVVATDESLLLVMEYVEGDSLHELLRNATLHKRPIPTAIGCAIVHDVLTGLHHAHDATDDDGNALKIIHRDVSPSNVMVAQDGLAKVLDFGIAKANSTLHLSEEGAVRGKVPYMAPEQLLARQPLDHRADVYSCGVVLWEVLTGKRLFRGENMALIDRILNEKAAAPSQQNPSIPRAVDEVVARALAKDPNARFPTAAAMAKALAQATTLASRAEISEWLRNEEIVQAASDPIAPLHQSDTFAPASAPALSPEPHNGHAARFRSKLTTLATLVLIGMCGLTIGAKRVTFSTPAHAHTTTAPPVATTTSTEPDFELPTTSAQTNSVADDQAPPAAKQPKAAQTTTKAPRPTRKVQWSGSRR